MNRPAVVRGRRAARLAMPTAALALVLAACSAGGAASPAGSAAPSQVPDAEAAPLEGTDWTLTEYEGPGGKTLPIPELAAASARFEAGKVTGNTGCNTFNGSYTLDGDKITIEPLATTMMACGDVQMALETAFTTAMGKVATWSISGDTLELRTAEGKVGLRFAASTPPSLTGTRWVAIAINNGKGAVQSVAAGTEVTAIFAEDGKLAGSGGCNQYNGPYTVDGDTIEIGPVGATKKLCEEAISTQEAAYFVALDTASTFAFNGELLELRDADGALQVQYQPTLP